MRARLTLLVATWVGTALAAETPPAHPQRANIFGGRHSGSLATADQGLAIRGKILARVLGSGGIVLYDLANPSAPVAIAELPVAGLAADGRADAWPAPVFVGDTLVVGRAGELVDLPSGDAFSAPAGLALIDTTNPAAPTYLGPIASEARCLDVDCLTTAGLNWQVFAMTTDGSGLFLATRNWNTADQSNWLAVERWELDGPRRTAEWRAPGDAHWPALALDGGRLIVAYTTFASPNDASGTLSIVVLDAPSLVPLAPPSTLGAGSYFDALATRNGYLYGSDLIGGTLRAFDVRDPAAIRACSTRAHDGFGLSGSRLVGDRWFLLGSSLDETRVADCSFTSPRAIGNYRPTGGVAAAGNLLYLTTLDADRQALVVLDISAATPLEVAHVGGASADGFFRDVAWSGDGAVVYVAANSSTDGVAILDAATLREIGRLSTSARARTIATSSAALFVGGSDRVSLFSTSADPAHPVSVGSLTITPAPVEGLDVFGDRLFVAGGSGYVHIYDLTATPPARLASIRQGERQCYGSFVEGMRLAIACDTGGVGLFDLTTPSSPVRIGEVLLPVVPGGQRADAIDVVTHGSRAFVASYLDGTDGQVTAIDLDRQAIDTAWSTDEPVRALAFAPDGTLVVPQWGHLERWRLDESSLADVVDRHWLPDFGRGLSFHGATLVAAATTGVVAIDLDTEIRGQAEITLAGATATCRATADAAAGFSWSFGDGAMSRQTEVAHGYAPGTWLPTLYSWTEGGLSHHATYVPLDVPEPTIEIVAPTDGATIPSTASVRVDVKGFELDCVLGDLEPGRGHWHLSLDGGAGIDVCTTTGRLPSNVDPGPHRLHAELVGGNHAALAPPRFHEIDVEIQAGPSWDLSLPGVAHLAGAAGSAFRTSLWIANPGAAEAHVRLAFVPATGFAGSSEPLPIEISIPSGGEFVRHDALPALYPELPDTFGVLLIDASSPIVAAARTYNQTEAGTFGQWIPAIPVASADNLAAIHGLAGAPAARSNLGVVNLGAEPMTATIRLRNAAGQRVGNALDVDVGPYAVRQLNRVDELATGAALELFGVEVEGSGPLAAYGSRLDAVTSDPIYLPSNPLARTEQWLDGIAKAPGSGGTNFASDLVVHAESATTAECRFVRRGESAVAASAALALAAGETKRFPDVLTSLFAAGDGAGRIEIRSAAPLVAWASTVSYGSQPGVFGQGIPALGAVDAVGAGGAYLPALSEDADTRTNFGAVNRTSSAATVVLDLFDEAGSLLGTKSFALAADTSLFVPRVIRDLLGREAIDLWAHVRSEPPGAILAWVSLIDNHSTDPTFVPARAAESAR